MKLGEINTNFYDQTKNSEISIIIEMNHKTKGNKF
jgi:hypothetical protein